MSEMLIGRIGDSVKPMTKGKVSGYSGPVEQVFSPAHVTMSFSQKQEIHESVIKDKVCADCTLFFSEQIMCIFIIL